MFIFLFYFIFFYFCFFVLFHARSTAPDTTVYRFRPKKRREAATPPPPLLCTSKLFAVSINAPPTFAVFAAALVVAVDERKVEKNPLRYENKITFAFAKNFKIQNRTSERAEPAATTTTKRSKKCCLGTALWHFYLSCKLT